MNLIGKTYYTPNNKSCKVIDILDKDKQLVQVEIDNETEKTIANEYLFFLTEAPRENHTRIQKPTWAKVLSGWEKPVRFNLLELFHLWQSGELYFPTLDGKFHFPVFETPKWKEETQGEYLQAVLDKDIELTIHTIVKSENNGNLYEMLDGRECLIALFHFLIGKNSLPCGAKFCDLSSDDANFFLQLNVHNYCLHILNPDYPFTNIESHDLFLTFTEKHNYNEKDCVKLFVRIKQKE